MNFSLVTMVKKLYVMLRNGEGWELDEPGLDGHGMPIIHDVARVLGCIRGSQDNNLSWPGKSSELHEIEPKIYLAEPEFRADKQILLSEAHHFSSENGRLSLQPQHSRTSFPSVEAATTNPLIQQDDWSLSWKHSVRKHQESQQKPDIIFSDILMQETQDDVSNPPFFPINPPKSPPYQFPKPEIDMFDTRGATNPLLSDIRRARHKVPGI